MHIFTVVLLHKYQYLNIIKRLFSSVIALQNIHFNYTFLNNIFHLSSGAYIRPALTPERTDNMLAYFTDGQS